MAKKIVKQSNNLFIADLGKLKLSAAQQQSIAAGIQEVVMLELANIDGGRIITVKPPRDWELQGIIVRPTDVLSAAAQKDINEVIGKSPFNG